MGEVAIAGQLEVRSGCNAIEPSLGKLNTNPWMHPLIKGSTLGAANDDGSFSSSTNQDAFSARPPSSFPCPSANQFYRNCDESSATIVDLEYIRMSYSSKSRQNRHVLPPKR